MTRIELQRHRSGQGSRFEVWISGKLWCYTENNDDGFKLMLAVSKLECIRVLGADFGMGIALGVR